MKIIKRGTIYSGGDELHRSSCTFPAICVLPEGRWIAGFRAAPHKQQLSGQHVCLTWSDDEGETWSKPISPFAPLEVGDGRPGTFRTVHLTALEGGRIIAVLAWVEQSNPQLPYFNIETEGLLDTKVFVAYSEDRGENWDSPKIMDTLPFQVPTPTTGPILKLANGELACQFELNKHYNDPNVWKHSSVLKFSKDGGEIWNEHTVVTLDPQNRYFYWDQRPAVIRDEEILDLFWTYDNDQATYLNMHARRSLDNGRTWSDFWDTGVPGQPAPPVPLKDHRVAMVYVDRTGAPTIKARISRDDGATWLDDSMNIYKPDGDTKTEQKDSMQDAWGEMSRFSIGLPTTALLPDGDFLVVYYAGTETDFTNIEWARVRP